VAIINEETGGKMKSRDTRYNVWVVEARMSDGLWFPMPGWGAGRRRKDALSQAMGYFAVERITWAMDSSELKHSRRIRIRRYVPEIPSMKKVGK
jgi:hypothetical protein